MLFFYAGLDVGKELVLLVSNGWIYICRLGVNFTAALFYRIFGFGVVKFIRSMRFADTDYDELDPIEISLDSSSSSDFIDWNVCPVCPVCPV